MACNLEDGEAGSGGIPSISGRVPTIPIYPRITARQENMETSVPSEPSIDHDMSRNIPPHSGSHHGSHHGSRVLQRYPRRLHHSDRKPCPLSKERHNGKHTDLSVTILRFPFPRDTEQREPPAPPTALGERACMIPTTPVLRQRGCCVPMVLPLWPSVPGGPPGGWLGVHLHLRPSPCCTYQMQNSGRAQIP